MLTSGIKYSLSREIAKSNNENAKLGECQPQMYGYIYKPGDYSGRIPPIDWSRRCTWKWQNTLQNINFLIFLFK